VLSPVIEASQTTRLELQVVAEYEGAALAIGDTKTDIEGGSYRLSFFAYYAGNFRLVDVAGRVHPATLVGADDTPLPYGLQLLNMDDAASLRVRLAVMPGRYSALRFGVGVHQACNVVPITERIWPLSIETEMSWGWTMLHMRLECFHQTHGESYGLMYHLGFPEEYRSVQVAAELNLDGGSAEHTLKLAVDRLLGTDTPSVIAPQQLLVETLPASGTFVLQ
jgi:hypothetical protein